VTRFASFVRNLRLVFRGLQAIGMAAGPLLCIFLLFLYAEPIKLSAQTISAPSPQTGTITGTVEDLNGGLIPGATVTIEGTSPDAHHSITTNGEGVFSLSDVPSAISLKLIAHADGFQDWTSPSITLTPGQIYDLTDIKLLLRAVETTVNAIMPEQLAMEQVKTEEHQRILGIIPNFYVVYDRNPMPLTAKLKFELALKAGTDAATIGGAAFLAGIYQVADTPAYQQGLKGYGQRFGATFANGFSDILIGGAVLPSVLHQDPRYFYQGTGSARSRAFHAILAPFVAKGDNGHWQFNYSSVGGDLASGALSNLYYPASNRGASLVFSGALITTGARMVNALAQEFVFKRLTNKSTGHD
jgi:hypothetical protein